MRSYEKQKHSDKAEYTQHSDKAKEQVETESSMRAGAHKFGLSRSDRKFQSPTS